MDVGYNLTVGGAIPGGQFYRGHKTLSDCHRAKHGNNLPPYIIKTGSKASAKSSAKSGYQIWKHPKCKRKRFTGDPKDDAKSLKRAIAYLKKLDADEIKPKEKLPKFMSYCKGHNSYCIQIPMKNKKNLRKEFRNKTHTRKHKLQLAKNQLAKWFKEYNITTKKVQRLDGSWGVLYIIPS